eukprot:GFKZ01009812.1.p1 GENE.GFKZ01009812.1~~GFKZ01009812.1.p1  ORF type:complete len:564 (+),score=21.84 GFKZ01009812.1:220-1692(+)
MFAFLPSCAVLVHQSTFHPSSLTRSFRHGISLHPCTNLTAHRPFLKLSAKQTHTPSPPATQPPSVLVPPPEEAPTRVFSNLRLDSDGSLVRKPASQLGCAALVSGTMIGAGVLALPKVAAPAGFVPSAAALMAVWVYMVATGLLISEVTINTACKLGRPTGLSVLSLGELTLGRVGAILTAGSYTLLHYAILTAYTSQGGAMLAELVRDFESFTHMKETIVPPVCMAALFAGVLGGGMYGLSAGVVERVNSALVGGVVLSFLGVLAATGGHVDVARLVGEMHWEQLAHGQILSVLFVSCVYHNVVSSVTMRLEGNRSKIRRVIVTGSGIPLLMFLTYNAAILGSSISNGAHGAAVAVFSLLAVATSFVGFVEGLTELWADVRMSRLGESEARVRGSRYRDFLATLVPPVAITIVSPDVFLGALDAAGTYGIAVLFGGLPAAMAWRNRRGADGLGRRWQMVAGGDAVLAVVGLVPLLLIGNKVWDMLHQVA